MLTVITVQKQNCTKSEFAVNAAGAKTMGLTIFVARNLRRSYIIAS